MLEPIYSGPNRSGICICGHSWENHHLSLVMRIEYIEETKEGYKPDECCFYGHNETGGLMLDKNDEWVPHCFGYRDKLDV